MGNSDFFPYKLWRIEICLPKEIMLNSRERKRGISEFCQPCLVQKTFSLINPPFHRTDSCFPAQTLPFPSFPRGSWCFLHQLPFDQLHCNWTQIHDGEWLLSSSIANWAIPGSTIAVSLTSLKRKTEKVGFQGNPEQQNSSRTWQMWLSRCSAGWAGDCSCLQDLGCNFGVYSGCNIWVGGWWWMDRYLKV